MSLIARAETREGFLTIVLFRCKIRRTDCTIHKIPNGIVEQSNLLSGVEEQLSGLLWEKLYTDTGRLARSTCWYTKHGCSCNYRYRGRTFIARDFPDWLSKLANDVGAYLNLEQVPDSCNFNLYEDGKQAVAYHADDEDLFKTESGETTIVSISFGATRSFGIERNFWLDKDAQLEQLDAGDIIVMTKRTQQYWQHAMIPEAKPSGAGIRYNTTFRYISQPHRRCKGCKNKSR